MGIVERIQRVAVLVGFVLAFPAISLGSAQPDSFLVILEDQPLATYRGDLEGLEATSAEVRGEQRFEPQSVASRHYSDFLDSQRAVVLDRLGSTIGRTVEPIHILRAAAHGFSVSMTPAEAELTRSDPAVARVIRDYDLEFATDAGPLWIGAPSMWDGSATGGEGPTRGEGIVIGMIDSGLNLDHPSFADIGGDGYDHINPLGKGTYTGWCDPANIPAGQNPGPFTCNDKLIGAWDFTDIYCTNHPKDCDESDGPEDDHSHGTHTAGIAVGNVLPEFGISGVAPHANLISYDACYTVFGFGGRCPLSNLVASVDRAILDQVDVISFSIVGGFEPWSDEDIESFFLTAVEAGVLVSSAAGNDGPSPELVMHRGPWVLTTAATTHHRKSMHNGLTDLSGGVSPPTDLVGQSRTGGYGPAPIVSAADFPVIDDADQCGDWTVPFPAGTWTQGEIVVCDNGGPPQPIACFNAMQGGAGGCVIANRFDTTGTLAQPHVLPATHIAKAEADLLRDWLSTGSGHMATITAAVQELDPNVADLMTDFSSRGPNPMFDVVKPDVAAPGFEIFSAARDDFVGFYLGVPEVPGLVANEFGTFQGTSMSTPHSSGAAALILSVHPELSPPEVKSALMLTAQSDGLFVSKGGSPATPAHIGAGRIELTKAALAGFVLDESGANFHAAEPALGGSPRTLNLASFMTRECASSCSWIRTLRSIADAAITWTVAASEGTGFTVTMTPNPLVLGAGESAEIEVEVTLDPGVGVDDWAYSELVLEPSDPTVPTAGFPVVVRRGGELFSDGFESGDTTAWGG